jgi:putative membrane protein
MNPPGNYDWHIPQRQATAGIIIMLYKTVVTVLKSLWVLIFIVVFRTGQSGPGFLEYMILGIAVLILVQSLVEFFYFRFYMLNDELIIKKGFLSKKHIAIPLRKIQAVHIEQGILHQLMNVAKVKIDTAGSEKTEAVIDAISVPKAEQLKTFLLDERLALAGEVMEKMPPPDKLIISLGAADILKMGLSANHIQAFFIVLAFFMSLYENLREAFGNRLEDAIEESGLYQSLISSVPVLVFVVLIVSVLVSMVNIMLKYHDFSLAETPQAFKLKSGLINSRQFVVPFSRIQFISWEANWVRRLIKFYNVEFHQATGSQVNEKQKIKVPVTRPEFIAPLFERYHALIDDSAHSEHHIHSAYPWRRTLMTAILPLVIILPITQTGGWNAWWLLLLLWIPYKYLNAWFYRKNFRLLVAPDAFQVNSGIWGREVQVVKWYKIQHVKLQQSIYQRRKGLATIRIYTAGGSIRIPYITLELAYLLQNYALYEVERLHRPWL